MAGFLFARALNKTEEFRLASNVEGAGAFDDLVFRYRLRDPGIWKTCFIQLKHKKIGGTIRPSSLTQMSGDFSLFKYFKSYCEIKNNAATNRNLKECGPFVDFEFVIYTNGKMKSKSPLQEGDSDPLGILSSGTDDRKYITFVENTDTDIFGFFEELSKYHELIRELDSLLKRGTSVKEDIIMKIEDFKCSVRNKEMLENLNRLKSNIKQNYVTRLMVEVSKCDFTLFKEFLNKVKIFHSQSNEESLKGLTEKELQEACKATHSVVNFIYTKFEEGVSNWWKKDGNVVWLNENSGLWQEVQKHIISERRGISKPEIQEILGFGISFNQQHLQKLSDAIKQNTVLNIVTNTNLCVLQKLKTFQALNILGYKNSLFIGINSLMIPRKEIHKLWPCKWSDVLVVDCDPDGKVAHTVLDILQQSTNCEKGLDISDNNTVDPWVDVLKKYQQKVILISPRQKASEFQEKLRNISYFEDSFDLSDLDEKSQKQILERPVNFQGTNVALSALVGTDPPDSIKGLLDSKVISILLNNELSVGIQLCDHCKYYIPRVLEHQIYLKEDILKRTDYKITFAVSGLQTDELKNYLHAGEKICEFVYDETERSHTFKIVSDFSKTVLSAECGTMKTHQKVGQKMKSDDVNYNIFRMKNLDIDVSEGTKINPFSVAAKFSKSGLTAELENMETYNEAGQNIKPEEVRYIALGNKNPDNEFRELKELCRNVHWIHVEDGSFLWRDTNGNIDFIRRYIDNTKCEKYNIKNVVEHNEKTMLLVAEPGMGKSTFLSYMAHEIKKWKPSVWVLRINLSEHTNELEETDFEHEGIDKCKMFLWSAAHSTQQDALKVTKEIFLQALEQTGKMVIILDGFDEISPDYSPNVETLIRTIRDKTASKIWISSRFSYRQELEDIVGNFAFTLKPFTPENQIQFLEEYWIEVTEISNQENLQLFAKKLLSLCSKNLSDKDEEFTGIPLQTMMLGEAFVNEAKEYCCSGKFNLPEKFNLLSLFKKFTENKFYIYFREKNEMDTSKLEVKCNKKDYVEKHMISALLYLFSPNEFKELSGKISVSNMEETKKFLREGKAQRFGIITDNMDRKPHFIHRCFAEYFAAKWFTDNHRNCIEFISNILFNTTNEVTRNILDRMFAEHSEIHGSILNNNIHALKEFLKKKKDINTLDKGGRTALHLAASYNSPYIQQLLSFRGIDANKQDAVLKWTPLRYADRTKSWMAMDILLQNDGNPEDIVLTRLNSQSQEWGQRALWECASKGHIQLLEFMLKCGIQMNAIVVVPENVEEKWTVLHRASYCGQVEVVRFIVNRGADINIRDAKNNTVLHLAAESGSVNIIKLLLDKGMSVNLTDGNDATPLHVSAKFGHLETTKNLVERGAAIKNTNKYGFTPLMAAAGNRKLEIFRYLTEIGADINIRNAKHNNNTALHYAAESGSVDIIKLLLGKGMSTNLTNTDKITPLHICAQFGHLEAMKVLVERGASINNTNKYGKTALMLAAQKGKLEIFRYLTEIGVDINIPDDDNNTTLHLAAVSGSVDMIRLLLDKGISVNLTNTDEFTPLHLSAHFGNLEATKALVERGAAINNATNEYGVTALMVAAKNGKLEIFRYLTERGGNINICNAKNNNNTALHYAAESGSVEIIKLLLDKGMSVNLTDRDDSTPLHISAHLGNLEATKALVEGGAAMNKATKKYGATALLVAAQNGKFEIFRYLTERGGNINICNAKHSNNTALHYAAESGSVEIIKLLLDKGMSVNVTNTDAFTPLHISAQCGHLEATKTLVERSAAVNSTNKYGGTPLMAAAENGKLETFRYLTEIGADINIPDDDNITALHLAAVSGNVDIIKILLDKGMSANLTDTNKVTPLHISAKFGHLGATKVLVEKGAAISKTSKSGKTALMVAAQFGKLEIFRYLTEIGADIYFRNAQENNTTALHLAALSGSVGIIKLLLDKGMSANVNNTDEFSPLHASVQSGHLEATKALVERGAAVNNTNKYGVTPLMLAAQIGKLQIFRYLTEIGADINIRNAKHKNNTALHYASVSGNVEIIKLLLDKRMSVNLTNTDKITPLHLSAHFGNLEATKALVEKGAAINNTNKGGETALMVAARNGKLETFRYITDMGADINIRNAENNNNTALHYAAATGSAEMIKLLLNKGMSVNLTNTHGSTPLHLSAHFGNLEATKALVERGADVNHTDRYGNIPLRAAANNGKFEVFSYLTNRR